MSLSFVQAVFKWRSIACCLWLVLLGIPGLLTFRLAVNIIMWKSWTILPSFRNMLFICVNIISLVIIVLVYSLTYTAKLPVFKTRLEALWNIFNPSHFIIILIMASIGAMNSYCLTELADYAVGLWSTCELESMYRTEVKCLNEYLLFCTIYGAVCGLCYGCTYYFDKEYFLVFPSLQKHKLFRIRGHFFSHLWEGLVWTLKVLRIHYPLYYICGSSVQGCIINLIGLHSPEKPVLNSITGLLDIRLLVHLIIIGSFIHLSWSFTLRLFRIYQTQAVVFPVVATFSDDTNHVLGVALTSDLVLLKVLGFLDLYQLSLHSPQRRKQVFSLNAAGQPIVWNTVSDECLKRIKMLTTRLSGCAKRENGFTKASADSSRESVPPESINQLSTPYSPQMSQNGKGWTTLPVKELVNIPGATRRHAFYEKARLWSYSPGEPVERIPSYLSKEKTPLPVGIVINKIKTFISSVPKRISERLKRKPFFIYFLNELPDADSQELFADCQIQVWAITSISELAVASYTEDIYGVVQKSLTSIISSLIDLSQALDKHVKAPLSNSKSTRNVRVALETSGKYAIKTAVQTALFRLAATFSREKRSLQLSTAHLLYWNKYFNTQYQN